LLLAALGGCATSKPVATVGQPAPELAGTTIDSKAVSLSGLRGHPVLVNFWGSWCVPCQREFPLLLATYGAHHQADGFEILGVLWNDSPAPARDFMARYGATWPSLPDPDGSAKATYRAVAPPQSYFIDRTGVILSRQIGELTAADLDRQLAAILR